MSQTCLYCGSEYEYDYREDGSVKSSKCKHCGCDMQSYYAFMYRNDMEILRNVSFGRKTERKAVDLANKMERFCEQDINHINLSRDDFPLGSMLNEERVIQSALLKKWEGIHWDSGGRILIPLVILIETIVMFFKGYHTFASYQLTFFILVVSLFYSENEKESSLRYLGFYFGLLCKYRKKWGLKKTPEYLLHLKQQESQKKWLEAMPASLKHYWNWMLEDPDFAEDNTQVMSRALNRQFPDPNARILALLTWYGSGEGPWSDYPSYENAVEIFLLLHDTQVILDAVQNVNLSEAQLEGLARFFCGWGFTNDRPQDIKLVTEVLKARLLEHVLESGDQDMIDNVKQAFDTKKGNP